MAAITVKAHYVATEDPVSRRKHGSHRSPPLLAFTYGDASALASPPLGQRYFWLGFCMQIMALSSHAQEGRQCYSLLAAFDSAPAGPPPKLSVDTGSAPRIGAQPQFD